LLAFVGVMPWTFIAFDSSLFHPIFKSFCHQLPERSLFFFDTQMVVCSRCAGIYSGIALGAITPSLGFMKRFGYATVWTALSIALLDYILQNFFLHSMNHASRMITGAMAGWAVTALLFSSIEISVNSQQGYGEN